MKRVKISELKDRLSEHLRAVEQGSELVITDRERPIARIEPIGESGRTVRVLPPSRAFAEVRGRRYSPARWDISSTELLLGERHRA